MEEMIEISWSAASLDEARSVARQLVEERLVACAQIVPWMESIYLWNGELETAQETKVLLKTKGSHLKKIEAIILSKTRYEVPEIIVRPLGEANSAYQDWLSAQIQGTGF